jgi:hypothetical protein
MTAFVRAESTWTSRAGVAYSRAMNAQSPSPVVHQLASRPCQLCGGTEFSHFPSVVFAQVPGSSSNYFEMLVCRRCRKTHMFVQLDQLERLNAHAVLRVPGAAPHR